ncbi:MAG TPA: Ku protein [Terriglobales bacterium]|nr:Ku protein [Terriglobales bacterium]
MAESELEEGGGRGRQIWSGTVSFGLVSIPVNLLPGSRNQDIALRMLTKDGTPVGRRYACSSEEKQVDYEQLVRGFDTGSGDFIVVTDEELESLAPEASRDIDLRRFVDLDDIDPIYFDRPYYLVPAGGSSKAYRLLAETMEKTKLAGIATFVMRGKEYLIAIMAEKGLMRAETLRFADEIRSAAMVGLPDQQKAAKKDVNAMVKAIEKMSGNALAPADLVDQRNRRLVALIEQKNDEGRDVVESSVESEPGEENVIDLMERLKESLRQRTPERAPQRHRGGTRKRSGTSKAA